MVNQQLLDYIKQCKQQGVDKAEITKALSAQGWQSADVEAAFQAVDATPASSIVTDTVQPTTNTSVTQPLKEKTPHNKIILIAVFVISGLIVAGAAFAGYMYFFPSPETVLNKMSQQLATIKTAEYRGEIKAEVPSEGLAGLDSLTESSSTPALPKIITMLASFEGKGSIVDTDNSNSQFSASLSSDVETPLGAAGSTLFGFESRYIAKIAYIKLTTLPNFGLFNLNFLTNQWIKIDLGAMQKEFAPSLNDQVPQNGLTAEQIQQIKDATAKAKLLTFVATLAGEKIEGSDMFHYKIALDKVAMKQWLQTVKKIVDTKEFTVEESKSLDEALAAVDLSNNEIWISKKDFLPYKVLTVTSVKDASKADTATNVTTTLYFKNYNQPIVVETPTSSKTFEDIFSEFMTSQLKISTSTTDIATSTTDLEFPTEFKGIK